jgi:hypothetical protein
LAYAAFTAALKLVYIALIDQGNPGIDKGDSGEWASDW